jgi:predicted dehydrogenase
MADVETKPVVYGTYDELYNDPKIDCIYVGSPHGFHYRDCMAAINAGKNVLCEKAFTINAREARSVFEAAKAKGVYVAEAMWLRHRPMIAEIRKQLYEDKVIGDVTRTNCNFHAHWDLDALPETSRLKNLELGAGTLLDIGIYSLTWAILTLDPSTTAAGGTKAAAQSDVGSEKPKVIATQSFNGDVEVATSAILHYPSSGRQGVITSTGSSPRGGSHIFGTIEGTDGFIELEGNAPSHPTAFVVYPRWSEGTKPEGKRYEWSLKPRQGFQFEADNTVLDLQAGRKESPIMPWSETIRVMEIMDEIRRQGGTKYPQDK